MLTNSEVLRRINNWAKKPRVKMPVCGHKEAHGRLVAKLYGNKIPYFLKSDKKHPEGWKPDYRRGYFYENIQVILACTKCSFKLLPNNLPQTAFRKKV